MHRIPNETFTFRSEYGHGDVCDAPCRCAHSPDACGGEEEANEEAPQCAALVPGDDGVDKPTVVVTDSASEAKPLEQSVTLSMSTARFVPLTAPPTDYFNIQADTKRADTGLYILWEFPSRRDYDIGLLHSDGSYAAQAHSFHTAVGTPAEAMREPGHGGEGTETSEKLVGDPDFGLSWLDGRNAELVRRGWQIQT